VPGPVAASLMRLPENRISEVGTAGPGLFRLVLRRLRCPDIAMMVPTCVAAVRRQPQGLAATFRAREDRRLALARGGYPRTWGMGPPWPLSTTAAAAADMFCCLPCDAKPSSCVL
jgi:hypothetical protein